MAFFEGSPESRGRKIIELLKKDSYAAREKTAELMHKGFLFPQGAFDDGLLVDAIGNRHNAVIQYCVLQRLGIKSPRHSSGGTDWPLTAALNRRDVELATRLIVAGADIDVCDPHGRTPTMLAIECGALDLVKCFPAGEIHKATRSGYSSLFAAIQGGHMDALNYVLAAKPRLDVVYGRETLLGCAIRLGRTEMFTRLVEAGCKVDPTAKDYRGYTLLGLAREYGDAAMKRAVKAAVDVARRKVNEVPAVQDTGWRLTGTHEVSLVEKQDNVPYNVTEVFNFSSGIYTRISQNRETAAESSAVMNISAIANRAFVETAVTQLHDLGGRLPEGTHLDALGVLVQDSGKTLISKPSGTP